MRGESQKLDDKSKLNFGIKSYELSHLYKQNNNKPPINS